MPAPAQLFRQCTQRERRLAGFSNIQGNIRRGGKEGGKKIGTVHPYFLETVFTSTHKGPKYRDSAETNTVQLLPCVLPYPPPSPDK